MLVPSAQMWHAPGIPGQLELGQLRNGNTQSVGDRSQPSAERLFPRGRDLFQATGLHRLLQVLLGLPEPLYQHHRLLTDGEGRKLAKSAGDTGLAELRARGASPADIRRMLGLL